MLAAFSSRATSCTAIDMHTCTYVGHEKGSHFSSLSSRLHLLCRQVSVLPRENTIPRSSIIHPQTHGARQAATASDGETSIYWRASLSFIRTMQPHPKRTLARQQAAPTPNIGTLLYSYSLASYLAVSRRRRRRSRSRGEPCGGGQHSDRRQERSRETRKQQKPGATIRSPPVKATAQNGGNKRRQQTDVQKRKVVVN